MFDKKSKVIVVNRSTGRVGYTIPEMHVTRQFTVREKKEIPFEELEALSYLPGGLPILKNYLVIKDEEAVKELGLDVQPEYYYNEEDVKRLLLNGSLNEFLDCLDFAPNGVLEMVKRLSVSLPVNDMQKREAILEKMNFNVTRAIEIQNSKSDEELEAEKQKTTPTRRANVPEVHTDGPVRRTTAPKYNVVKQ